MQAEDPYRVLEVEPGADEETIRRAYARAVRRHPPEQDPVGFSRIRRAYDQLRDGAGRAASEGSPGAGPTAALLQQAAELQAQGRLLRAGAVLKRALVLFPGNRAARLAFVQNLQARGRHRDAVREIDRLLRRGPLDSKLFLLAAKAKRLWAEMPGSAPRRVQRLVRQAFDLLDLADGLGESDPAERMLLHLLLGAPERALEVLEQAVTGSGAPSSRDVELLVLGCLVHLDRRDRAAWQRTLALLERPTPGHPGRSLAGQLLAEEAVRRAQKGDLATLPSLIRAAERVAGGEPRVEALLEIPRDLVSLLAERQAIPLDMLAVRRLLGLEIDYLRLPAGRDEAILEHWGEVTARLRQMPPLLRQRELRMLREHCPTFCRRNAEVLAGLEEPAADDDWPF